jgi:4-amino-4-deoxy-L-arabinose transferase-like glycosyltransferase
MNNKRTRWPLVVLILILAFAAFFRFWMLSDIPPGVYPDEAKNANDAVATLQSGDYPIFYPENNGREGLYIWLIALAFKYIGISIFSLKLVSALAGTLTVLATYLLAKELFRLRHFWPAGLSL